MWILLSKTKKKCWVTWVLFTAILVGLTLIQTISGKLGTITTLSWCWIGINILPAFIAIFIAVLLDRQTARIIPVSVHRLLWIGSLLYLLLVLFTLLAEQAAITGTWSMRDYRMRSFAWLLPFQGILVTGFYLLFFRAKALFSPDEQAITEVAGKEAEHWKQKQNQKREEYFRMIAAGRIGEVFETIMDSVKKSGVGDLDRLVLLKSQFTENRRGSDLNLISYEEYSRNQNRIIMALMNMINQKKI